MECIVIDPISKDGVRIEPGAVVHLDEREFDQLSKLGCVMSRAEKDARDAADVKIAAAREAAEKQAREAEAKIRAELEAPREVKKASHGETKAERGGKKSGGEQ